MGRHTAYRVTELEGTDHDAFMRQQSRAASKAFAQALNIQPTENKPRIVFAPEVEILKREITERDIALDEAAAKILEKDKQISELCLELESKAASSDPNRATRIIRSIATAHGITFNEMISPRRDRNIVRARQHAMFELQRNTNLSNRQISRRLGRADPTTVIHGSRQHKARLARGEV
jgi:chromosomal replication initiation ATPase DnaA